MYANPVIAAEIFCDIADDGLAPRRGDEWPLRAAGAEGWLQYGQDLSMTDHHVGEAAARALSAALAEADPADAQAVIAALVQRLHNAGAWAALMSSATDPAALGQNLLPTLESGALLAHPQSHAAAAGLLAALAEHEPELADRLEAAVLQAHALADANGVAQAAKDALIGCLQPDAITSPTLRARLDELGAEDMPDPQPYKQVETWSRQWSILDSLAEEGIELEPEVETAAQTLDEELQAASGNSGTKPESERRLAEAFDEAYEAFASFEPLPPALELLLVRAAEALARDCSVLPATALGERVLAVLTEAAGSTETGEFLG